jgi:hypothetical protein
LINDKYRILVSARVSSCAVESLRSDADGQPAWPRRRRCDDGEAGRRGHVPDNRVEFPFEELTEATGDEFDQNAFEEIMSTHYGRMVAQDDRMILFANPEDAAEYLGFDLKPVS